MRRCFDLKRKKSRSAFFFSSNIIHCYMYFNIQSNTYLCKYLFDVHKTVCDFSINEKSYKTIYILLDLFSVCIYMNNLISISLSVLLGHKIKFYKISKIKYLAVHRGHL